MDVITVDGETYYDQDYSLSKMSEVEYILDHRFQTIMFTFKKNDEPTEVAIGHDAVKRKFATYDWSRSAFCSHNTRFDGSIAAWHFGVEAALYLDTLSMARATVHAATGRSSLDQVSKYLRLPPKGDEVVYARGKRLEDFTPDELQRYVDYCIRDTDNCREIFKILRRCFSHAELLTIDWTIRLFCEPQVFLDPNKLAEHLANVRAEKAAVMAKVSHIDKSVFSSNQKFAELLRDHGIEPPTKISPTTGKETYALAKNDRAFKELCDDGTLPIMTQAILAARINSKSTIEETRTQSLLDLSLQSWGERGDGWAPIPIKYFGAHTGRASGDGGWNWQNFKRNSPIHDAIVAPEGHRIVHRDSSQIEARMLAMMSRCEKMINQFREKRDIYSEFASTIYNRRVSKADKQLRFVGKTCILGLGFQTGAEKLRHTLFIGNGGMSVRVEMIDAQKYVWTYRRTYREVPDLWNLGDHVLSRMLRMNTMPTWEPSDAVDAAIAYPYVTYNDRAVWLPNGMPIQYLNLRQERGSGQVELVYDNRGQRNTIYGGKLCLRGDTLVLTRKGWRKITAIMAGDEVWDGEVWVSQDGCVYQGEKVTTTVVGVGMTPDHLVLTTEGWRRASQSEGHYRAESRLPDSGGVCWQRWEEVPLDSPMRLREHSRDAGDGTTETEPTRDRSVLRVQTKGEHRQQDQNPRHGRTPSVCSVAQHARPLQIAYSSGVAQLRRAWYQGMRAVASLVRGVLGGYGADLSAGPHSGAARQQRQLRTGELRVGNIRATGEQPAPAEPVYDLLNVGPRRRFVVRDEHGYPLIVHNCENVDQGLARIVVTEIARRVQRETGYRPFLFRHDSLDYCVPVEKARDFDKYLEYEFSVAPDWISDIPLASEGGFGWTLGAAERMENA